MKTINRLWFDKERIFIEKISGEVRSQPMMFFPRLRKATERQRNDWTESHCGIHWDNINEDVSFESFNWDDNDPITLYHHV